MKRILVFPLILCSLNVFAQHNPLQNYTLNWYADYQKLSDNVRDLFINFHPEAKDSCYRLGLDFSKFKDLYSANYYIAEHQDSLFEAYIYEKLGDVSTLTQLAVNSTYKHNFSRFENLEVLNIGGKGGIGNTSISSLKFLTRIGIGDVSGDEILASDPIFQLKQVTTINTGHFYDEPFPFEFLGQMEQLESIIIQGSVIKHIPKSWKKLTHLKTLSVGTAYLKGIPSFMCSSLTNLSIQSYNCPTLPACLLKKEKLKLSINVYTTNKGDLKKIKRYKKQNTDQNKRINYSSDVHPEF